MSGNVPFGFGQSRDPDDENNDPNPQPAGFNMSDLGAALQQLGSMLQSGGGTDEGPVNWTTANDTARQAIAAETDPSVSDAQRRAVTDAVGLADLWLNAATEFPASPGTAQAWSRSEWLESTLPAWKLIVTPVAEQLQATMQGLMPGEGTDLSSLGIPGMEGGLPPEIASMAGPLMGMAKAMGSAMFGMQVGQGLAALAGEVVSSTDVGIPLTTGISAALVPSNIRTFSEGLDLPDADVLMFLSLREVAHQRLFAHVPWLRSRVEGALEAYARGIKVDQSRIEDAMQGMDMSNPEALQEQLASGVFEQEDTEEQKAALARLETLLALIEGWVDDVVDAAVADRLPSYDRLRETLRRRRAIGGPAEKTFATLVGLELRPRSLREAAALWEQLRLSGGAEARDALWDHPDLLPTADDLDDVAGFIARTQGGGDIDVSALSEPASDEVEAAASDADGGVQASDEDESQTGDASDEGPDSSKG